MHITRRLSTSPWAVAQMDHGSGYGIRARGLVPPADVATWPCPNVVVWQAPNQPG